MRKSAGATRTETDTLGPPAERLWSAQTQNEVIANRAIAFSYEKAAQIARKAYRDGTNLYAAALALGTVSAEEFAAWVRPEEMTRPRGAAARPPQS